MLGTGVRSGLEIVVRKLHRHPNPNKDMWEIDLPEIVDVFWTKFEEFRKRPGGVR